MPYATLPQRGLLALTGRDTLPFLQGLVTNDVLHLHDASIVYAALLTPQGKYLHDFFVLLHGGVVVVDCDKTQQQALIERLTRYKLRSQVAIEPVAATMGVYAVWGEEIVLPVHEPGLTVLRDPRLGELGYRLIGPHEIAEQWLAAQGFTKQAQEDYELMRIRLGVPEGGQDFVADKSFILQYGFEQLHGVDFKKGCYIGQEVTARTKHLGQLRKCIYQVRADAPLPPAGTPVRCGDNTVGELRSSVGREGLALLAVAEAHAALFAGDVRITAELPRWAGFLNVPGKKQQGQ